MDKSINNDDANFSFSGSVDRSELIPSPVPFLKWVGGKRRLLKTIIKFLPKRFESYYEPFLGGGALFYRIGHGLKKAFLSDINRDLITVYHVVKNFPNRVLQKLEEHREKHCKEYYYRIRNDFSDFTDPIVIAARFLYLNKTCYNGLYRVNKKGRFNVPFGRYKNPDIVAEKNLSSCSELLRHAETKRWEFDRITPEKNDFVYFDPPYHQVVKSCFSGYTKDRFTEKDQMRLRDFALSLYNRGVYVMLSNSDTPFTRELYEQSPFIVRFVQAPRRINCNPQGRGIVSELLITSYK